MMMMMMMLHAVAPSRNASSKLWANTIFGWRARNVENEHSKTSSNETDIEITYQAGFD